MNTKHYIILLAIVGVICVAPLILVPNAEFGGADGGAEQAISDTGYEPWFTPIWEPPSGEIESLLFALQAAIGAVIIGYFIGYERGKRVKK
ncbi:MAG: energy-coupling factor ABC transporter substrate-binding protein [Candidatus Bathyarchaeia archaeon]|jgi:cobalt/nickel transport protein